NRGVNRLYKLNALRGIGVRWQSLIVSPKKLAWMNIAEVGNNPRFGWWKRLREVDCSWISSRGESERFLYYDGPTYRPAMAKAAIAKGQLLISGIGRNRPGLYIEVTAAGITTRFIDDADALRPIFIDGLAKPTPNAEKDLAKFL